MENEKEGKGTSILDTITEGVSSITEAMTGRTQSPGGGEGIQARRKLPRRKGGLGGPRQSVPLVADGLLLPQAAGLRGNPRPAGERQSGLAQEELVPQLLPAGPHGRRVLANRLEVALKRSEAPRNPGHPKLVGTQRSAARGRTSHCQRRRVLRSSNRTVVVAFKGNDGDSLGAAMRYRKRSSLPPSLAL